MAPCPVSGRVFLSRVTCPVSRPRGAAASPNPHQEFHLTCTLAATCWPGADLAALLQCIFTFIFLLPANFEISICPVILFSLILNIFWKNLQKASAAPAWGWWVPDTNMENMEKLSSDAASRWAQPGRCCTQMRSLWHFPRKICHFVTLAT